MSRSLSDMIRRISLGASLPPMDYLVAVLRLAVLRLAVLRLAVLRLAVLRLAVLRLAVLRLAVLRLARFLVAGVTDAVSVGVLATIAFLVVFRVLIKDFF
jgi:uncharacterized protein YjbI with pentapeptide repeats